MNSTNNSAEYQRSSYVSRLMRAANRASEVSVAAQLYFTEKAAAAFDQHERVWNHPGDEYRRRKNAVRSALMSNRDGKLARVDVSLFPKG